MPLIDSKINRSVVFPLSSKMSPENLVFAYLRPILRIGQCLGTFPFSMELRFSYYRLVYLFCVLTVKCYITFGLVEDSLFLLQTVSADSFSTYITLTNKCVRYSCDVIMCIFAIYKGPVLKKIVFSLSNIDMYMSLMFVQIKYKNGAIVKSSIARIVYYTILGMLRYYKFEMEFFSAYSSVHRFLGVYFHNLIFTSLILAVSDHFETLTFELLKKDNDSVAVRKLIYTSRSLFSVWDQICDFCNHQVFFTISLIFLEQLEIYQLLRSTIFGHLSWDNFMPLAYSVMITFAGLMDTKQQIDACEKVKQNVKDFSAKLSQIYISNNFPSSTRDLIGIHFAMNPVVQLEAWGFYKIDYTLIYSMVSSTVTYMIILLQAERSSLNKQLAA